MLRERSKMLDFGKIREDLAVILLFFAGPILLVLLWLFLGLLRKRLS